MTTTEVAIEGLLAESKALTAAIARKESEASVLRDERLAVWAQLRQLGVTDAQIAASAGLKHNAVTMARRRGGEATVGTRNRGPKL